MRYLVVCSLAACLSGFSANAQVALGRQAVAPVGKPTMADMTHEETMVRTAYAKFAYASEQEAIGQLALEAGGTPAPHTGLSSDQRLALAHTSFQLSDFTVGNLSDIINRKAVDLISPPIGEMLTASTPIHSYSDYPVSTTWYSVQPQWQPATVTSPEVRNANLGQLHAMAWHTQAPTTIWQRYASYSVTVTFQGKSCGPYKALFIFGHDGQGSEMVMPEDANTDSTALARVLAVHLFPDAFLRTRMRTYPVVADWINTHKKYGATCSRGQGDVCCDLVQLECGLGSDDVADGLRQVPD